MPFHPNDLKKEKNRFFTDQLTWCTNPVEIFAFKMKSLPFLPEALKVGKPRFWTAQNNWPDRQAPWKSHFLNSKKRHSLHKISRWKISDFSPLRSLGGNGVFFNLKAEISTGFVHQVNFFGQPKNVFFLLESLLREWPIDFFPPWEPLEEMTIFQFKNWDFHGACLPSQIFWPGPNRFFSPLRSSGKNVVFSV